MNLALVAIICLSVLCLAFGYDKDQHPGKIVTWTFDGSIQEQPGYNTKTIGVSSAVDRLSSNAQRAEIVAFLKTKNSKQSIFSNAVVSPSMSSASSSVVAMNVYRDQSMDAHSESVMANHLSQSPLFTNSREMSLVEFKEHLETASSHMSHPLHNGKIDSYIITLQDEHAAEEKTVLADIARLGSSASPLTFVAVQEPARGAFVPATASRYSELLSTDTLDGSAYSPEGSEYSIYYQGQYLYITPDIFTGLMTGLFVTFVIITGLSCLGDIQGASIFASKSPAVGREA